MKKLVLLGDSIRMLGYGNRVADELRNEFITWQPDDNCRFAQYTLRMLFDYKERISGADIIHFNCGLWDMCDLFGDGPFTGIDEYCGTMQRIAKILQNYAKRVIFSTSTPPRPEKTDHSIDRIIRYNEKISKILSNQGIIVNDLFSVVYPHVEEYVRDDDLIHLTDAGISACASSIVKAIRAASDTI